MKLSPSSKASSATAPNRFLIPTCPASTRTVQSRNASQQRITIKKEVPQHASPELASSKTSAAPWADGNGNLPKKEVAELGRHLGRFLFSVFSGVSVVSIGFPYFPMVVSFSAFSIFSFSIGIIVADFMFLVMLY